MEVPCARTRPPPHAHVPASPLVEPLSAHAVPTRRPAPAGPAPNGGARAKELLICVARQSKLVRYHNGRRSDAAPHQYVPEWGFHLGRVRPGAGVMDWMTRPSPVTPLPWTAKVQFLAEGEGNSRQSEACGSTTKVKYRTGNDRLQLLQRPRCWLREEEDASTQCQSEPLPAPAYSQGTSRTRSPNSRIEASRPSRTRPVEWNIWPLRTERACTRAQRCQRASA